jgi:hypothetical protein
LGSRTDADARKVEHPCVPKSERSPLTGTMRRRTEEVAGQMIISTVACCGDEGGGLFVCRPPAHGR